MVTCRAVVIKHLGRKCLKFYESLMVNIHAVDEGVKSGYLYDIGSVTSDQLLNLLKELKQENLIKNNLNLIEIEMDYIIVNVEELLTGNLVDNLQDRLINVSDSIKQPCIVESLSVHNELESVFSGILQKLDTTKVKLCVLGSSIGCNISSLFGLLLNYPVIYWYLDSSAGNCLSMEKLVCVKVDVTHSEHKQQRFDQGSEPCKSHQGRELCHRSITLYSFSFPHCMYDHCKMVVDTWYSRVEDKINNSDLFSNLKYNSEEVVLEAVCL